MIHTKHMNNPDVIDMTEKQKQKIVELIKNLNALINNEDTISNLPFLIKEKNNALAIMKEIGRIRTNPFIINIITKLTALDAIINDIKYNLLQQQPPSQPPQQPPQQPPPQPPSQPPSHPPRQPPSQPPSHPPAQPPSQPPSQPPPQPPLQPSPPLQPQQQQPQSQLIHVIIPVPNGVTAGQTFIAFASLYKLRITVPPGVTAGQLLYVTFTLQQTEKEIIDISSDFISNNELLCIKNLKDVYIDKYKRKEEWILLLELVKKYIDENKKSPSRSNKDKNVKKLGVWISRQKENYKNKKYTVYNETIRPLWQDFIIEYKKYI